MCLSPAIQVLALPADGAGLAHTCNGTQVTQHQSSKGVTRPTADVPGPQFPSKTPSQRVQVQQHGSTPVGLRHWSAAWSAVAATATACAVCHELLSQWQQHNHVGVLSVMCVSCR
jgi:hypothetical protein